MLPCTTISMSTSSDFEIEGTVHSERDISAMITIRFLVNAFREFDSSPILLCSMDTGQTIGHASSTPITRHCEAKNTPCETQGNGWNRRNSQLTHLYSYCIPVCTLLLSVHCTLYQIELEMNSGNKNEVDSNSDSLARSRPAAVRTT